MENKEQYIQMRNRGKFDINWFYRYYIEKGGKVDFNTFQHTFQLIFHIDENVLGKLDKEFGLTTLHDKEGRFIKVVE